MFASLAAPLSHIASRAALSPLHLVVAGVTLAFAAGLVLHHLRVKHGRIRPRHLRAPIAIIAALGMTAAVAPTPGFAQSTIGPMGLPDLISDPPFIWSERDLKGPDGQNLRVLRFDGFLHNIGTGALDLAGNPQVEGGVKQRVFDGETWEDVGTPLVRFETDDGHNHFHLINAAEYSLWNEAQNEQVETGSKIGFCLLDTQQIERGVDATYNIDDINYCNVDEPDSTDLRMGISPGWVDIYEASVTLQWVDVSNTKPGRYWIGAIIDPNDEIVESNEDNNGLVFSSNKYAVSGYVARELPTQSGDIVLKSIVYGTVGDLAYVIVDPPRNGTLSVPTGVDLLTAELTYVPDAGFTGIDSFTYYAHDLTTQFPFDPAVVEVQVDASLAEPATAEVASPEGDVSFTAPTETISATRYERISIELGLEGATPAAAVRWFGDNLPPGLHIDEATGIVDGELTMPFSGTSRIVARIDGTDFEHDLTWDVADTRSPSLRAIGDFSTSLDRRNIVLGPGTAETNYEASGLPAGLVVTSGQPSMLGTPEEAGEFEVVVDELLDGEVINSVSFTLTVRPAARPEFAL